MSQLINYIFHTEAQKCITIYEIILKNIQAIFITVLLYFALHFYSEIQSIIETSKEREKEQKTINNKFTRNIKCLVKEKERKLENIMDEINAYLNLFRKYEDLLVSSSNTCVLGLTLYP